MSKFLHKYLLFLTSLFIVLYTGPVMASATNDTTVDLKKKTNHLSLIKRLKSYNQLDAIDVIGGVFNRKPKSQSDSSMRKGKVHVSLLPALGYTQSSGFIGVVSGNLAWFTSPQNNLNESNVSGNVSYSSKRQAVLALQPNIWTPKDAWNIIGDDRIINYPQPTFGLGGNTPAANGALQNYFLLRVRQAALRHIYKDLYAGIGYDFDYHFGITQSAAADKNTDYQTYGGGTKSISSGPKLLVEYDSRRNAINPRGGFYAGVIYTYYSKFLGSDNNYNSLKGDFRVYLPVSRNKKHLLAFWNYDWFTFNGHAPYLDLPATGWDDFNATGRGYVQSRFRGKNMLYLESEYRFPILNNGFLGGVVFVNAESFTDYPSNKFTAVQPGWGLGLRVKLNKKSGTNICFDYGFGLHGSNDFIINVGELF